MIENFIHEFWVILYDQRGHGLCKEDLFTYGQLEALDLKMLIFNIMKLYSNEEVILVAKGLGAGIVINFLNEFY